MNSSPGAATRLHNIKRYDDNSTLVVIFLRGGADTLNMLVPYGDDDYHATRNRLALKPPRANSRHKENTIRLDDFYGFHPYMAPLLPMYQEGRLALVQSVGCHSYSGSHFYIQDLIERGAAEGQTLNTGWLTRHLDTLAHKTGSPMSAIAMGHLLPASLLGHPSVGVMEHIHDLKLQIKESNDRQFVDALSSLYQNSDYAMAQRSANSLKLLAMAEDLESRHYKPEAGVDYPHTRLGLHMRQMARLIKSDVGVEVGCIDYGNWDTHYAQGIFQYGYFGSQVREFASAFAAFDKDLAPVRERVTVVVMTEFGRRAFPNVSNGTDHGRGSAYMVLGNNINGGKVLGGWPGLEERNEYGPGGLSINYDFRSVLAEILEQKLGNPSIDKVFPDLERQQIGIFRA